MKPISTYRNYTVFGTSLIMTILCYLGCIFIGSVDIPFNEIVKIISGEEGSKATWTYIILESRIPLATTALLSGAALSVAGLLLQTTFQNPLAGPSILGVSTGASMGVAIVMLGIGGVVDSYIGQYIGTIIGAIAGAGIIILILLLFSSTIKNNLMLLIVGILISHLSSSLISLLNFFSEAEEVKAYVIWGLGSFAGVTSSQLPLFSISILTVLICSFGLIKPLNALLLGERYAQNMGYNIRAIRSCLLVVSGLLTAIVTAFCGPIAFIGLIVPHVARLLLNSSNHTSLIPATMLLGGMTTLLCTLLSVLPSSISVVPINAITPIIGVPIIIYVILYRKRLNYFN